jgi:hypothetical protein
VREEENLYLLFSLKRQKWGRGKEDRRETLRCETSHAGLIYAGSLVCLGLSPCFAFAQTAAEVGCKTVPCMQGGAAPYVADVIKDLFLFLFLENPFPYLSLQKLYYTPHSNNIDSKKS